MEIKKTEIDVDIETLTANIDAAGNGVYIAQEGKIFMYPLPKYGKIELSSQNYKVGKPKYHISAD
ncbi:hypothetical protein GLV94_05235 [Virgibacillus halodenitrificans]|uniref:hypothetical protein n=1 Tax=Virgibacillus halodenitrificans TaxID=1482 RepID=UPI000EF50698|nr:hypothetical protein [Virgibacillus halodenitrificans]MYL45038.1 hypothetical protein [Virgibacillus halodenitrificans]